MKQQIIFAKNVEFLFLWQFTLTIFGQSGNLIL